MEYTTNSKAGRVCPIDYRIADDAFSGKPSINADIAFVVGGLYGNPFALDALDDLINAEGDEGKDAACNKSNIAVIFNGDMHWFDKTAANFANIENKTAKYTRLIGNVEAELRREGDVGVGCGCAYPPCVSDESVARSNAIHAGLKCALLEEVGSTACLADRASTAIISVAGHRVGITHGDEKLIGGWDCSRESMAAPKRQQELDAFLIKNNLDAFVTTHTCASAAVNLPHGYIINNGAAGLPNYKGHDFGLVIRLAKTPAKEAIFGECIDGLWVQAVPLRYDSEAFLEWFDALWPAGSPAEISYRSRIVGGTNDKVGNETLDFKQS
jgi:hypothetical protein